MMKKALIFTLTVLVVLLAGCGVMPAVEKEGATQSQTVSFPAGNETVSEQRPIEAEKETEAPVQIEEEKSSKAGNRENPSTDGTAEKGNAQKRSASEPSAES